MSIESILADSFRVAGVVIKASLKMAEATAAAAEVAASALSSWAERARVKNDVSTIEEWSKITTPSKRDIEAVKAKIKASKEASEDLNSKSK